MATIEDYSLLIFGIIGTLVVTVVGGLFLRHFNVIGKTKDSTTLATFNIGGMQEDFREIKADIKALSEKVNLMDRQLYGVELRLRGIEGKP